MNHKVKAGLMASMMTLGLLGVAAPNAHAAAKIKEFRLGAGCHAEVQISNEFTAGRVRGSFALWCEYGGGLSTTPTISIYENDKRIKSESPLGAESITHGDGASAAIFVDNKSGRQCYQAFLMVQVHGPGDGSPTKSGKTACINI